MRRVRLTIRHNPHDPADDLRYAAKVRRDLWSHSPVEVDPDSPLHGTHRDTERNAYFEFSTDHLKQVERVLSEHGHQDRVTLTVAEEVGPECADCGNVAGPILPPVCPTCGFRDISACPHCHNEVARQSYLSLGGDLFRCPSCHQPVRFRFHDPLFDEEGHYRQPLVVVEPAAEEASWSTTEKATSL